MLFCLYMKIRYLLSNIKFQFVYSSNLIRNTFLVTELKYLTNFS